eukprot:9150889-Alexandrium_andersonii.AAC.1
MSEHSAKRVMRAQGRPPGLPAAPSFARAAWLFAQEQGLRREQGQGEEGQVRPPQLGVEGPRALPQARGARPLGPGVPGGGSRRPAREQKPLR